MKIGGIGTLASLVVWLGVASTADASATIDLYWGGTSATTSSVSSSDLITLHVALTAGPSGSWGAGVTVDYSGAVGALSVVQATSNPGSGDAPFTVFLGPAVDTGSQVSNVNAACFPNAGLCFLADILA